MPDTTADQQGEVFSAAPSMLRGTVLPVAAGLVVVSVLGGILAWRSSPVADRDLAVSSLTLVGVVAVSLVVAGLLPGRISYETSTRSLTIRCRGVLAYVVDLRNIDFVERGDLRLSLLASFRLPGLALGRVHYADVGVVHMCATRPFRDVVLVHTSEEVYGVTPDREPAFVEALRGAVRRAAG